MATSHCTLEALAHEALVGGTLVVHWRGRTCHVVDFINFEKNRVDNIVPHQLKVGFVEQVRHVLLCASEKVVHAYDLHTQSAFLWLWQRALHRASW